MYVYYSCERTGRAEATKSDLMSMSSSAPKSTSWPVLGLRLSIKHYFFVFGTILDAVVHYA